VFLWVFVLLRLLICWHRSISVRRRLTWMPAGKQVWSISSIVCAWLPVCHTCSPIEGDWMLWVACKEPSMHILISPSSFLHIFRSAYSFLLKGKTILDTNIYFMLSKRLSSLSAGFRIVCAGRQNLGLCGKSVLVLFRLAKSLIHIVRYSIYLQLQRSSFLILKTSVFFNFSCLRK
jgi:hypothetical protein